ncbi:MAG: bifunctional adenosylcobinamide kinase/adenosylcobinamide-phosphate guanylyltransferase [Solirubrobacteraceae bacterium]
MKTLILGGVRSGKSRYAEELATTHNGPVAVIVTATAGDEEMADRIAAHRARRPKHWRVLEEPIAVGHALLELARPGSVVIIDCLTLWLTNILLQSDARMLRDESDTLLGAIRSATGSVILVSNEVGSGIVPINELARRFTDAAGSLHQRLAQVCDQVVWMVAGLPLTVKGPAK